MFGTSKPAHYHTTDRLVGLLVSLATAGALYFIQVGVHMMRGVCMGDRSFDRYGMVPAPLTSSHVYALQYP